MCFVPGASHSVATMTTTAHQQIAGCKRPREEETPTTTTTTTLALYDPSAAADQQRANPAAADDASAGALVPSSRDSSAGALVPISAVPLRAVAPKKLAPSVARAEPPWLRMGLLRHLKIRIDMPVHFIDEKAVTSTDLDPHQNRFRLPTEGVIRNLRSVLTEDQRAAANLTDEEAPRPPRLLPAVPGENGQAPARKKRKGKKHGGLPVIVIEPHSGTRELQLSRWESSGGTVIKGEGYMEFIQSCGFKVGDVVQIWAFRETYFHFFGNDVCLDGPLHLLITKIRRSTC